jgi:hypothetical protein
MRTRFLASFTILFALIFAFVPQQISQAANIKDAPTDVVTNLNANGPGSLVDTIAHANSGDTIMFDPSLFQGGPRVIDTNTGYIRYGHLNINKNLTIQGPGADKLTLNANLGSRIFNIESGVTAKITGLTIEKGKSYFENDNAGGGIYNSGTLTLMDDVFAGDNAGVGGAIYNDGGLMTISNSTLPKIVLIVVKRLGVLSSTSTALW